MEIVVATKEHIPVIQKIAKETWFDTYAKLLSKEQIDYMLNMMYSSDVLKSQMDADNFCFLLVRQENTESFFGFVSYETSYMETNKTKLHKLYILPQCQATGAGRIFVDKVCEGARKAGNDIVFLHMNRDNKALNFYKRMGFEIVGEGDFDIGGGFLMEDYIFEKKLT